MESLEHRRVLAAVNVVEMGGTTNVAESGGVDIFAMSLDTVPTGNVEITSSADAQTEVSLDGVNFFSSIALTFTDLSAQLIMVRAIDDGDAEGDHTGTITQAITSTADAVNYPLSTSVANVTVNIADNDQTVVELDGSNDLIVSDPSDHDDNLTISLSGANIRVHDPTIEIVAGAGATQVDANTVEVPTASITGGDIAVNGNGGSDSLVVDLSGGTFNLAVAFDGGLGNDTLSVTGAAVANVTHQFQSASDGSIDITGNATITYTGLEPIVDNLDAMNRVFTFTGGSETILLSDDADLNDGESFIDSTLGESVTFTNPTVSLTVNAGSGADTINLSGLDGLFAATLEVNGDAADDTINLTAVTGASVTTLNGGAGADVFDIDATLTGSLDGEAGADTLQGDLVDNLILTASDADGFAGTEADISLGFDGIVAVVGNGGTLTGANTNSSWLLDGTPTYNDGANTLNFSGFAALQGGSMVDQFTVSAASTFHLRGGADADQFTIDAALTGSVDGEMGADALSGTQIDSITLTGSDVDGFAGTEADISLGFDGITNLTGNGGTLTGADQNSSWLLDGTPTYHDGANMLDVSGFAALQGGSQIDQFDVTAASAFALFGGGGEDTFQFANAGSITGALDGQAGDDSLIGDDDGNAFTVTGPGQGLLSGKTTGFSSIENLQGGSDNDSFDLGITSLDTLTAAITIAGGGENPVPMAMESVTANGQTVTVTTLIGDRLRINDQNHNVAAQYNLTDTNFDRDSAVATTTFTSIETIELNTGSANNDTNIVNTPGSSHTTVTSQNAADDVDVTVTGDNSAVVVLTAGGDDTVDVVNTGVASVTIVQGGGENDSLMLVGSGNSAGVALHGESGTDLLRATGSGTAAVTLLTGGGDNDQFEVTDVDATSFLELAGGGGEDSLLLDFSAGAPVPASGLLFDGGADNDVLGVSGDGTNTIRHLPDAATPGDGVIEVDAVQVQFSMIERSEISNGLIGSLILPGANDVLTLSNGTDLAAGGTNPLIEVTGTSGGTGITTVGFYANATVSLETATVADGTDQITIASADNNHLNSNLTLSTGANGDTVTFGGQTAVSGTFTIASLDADVNDNADAAVDVTANSLAVTAATFGDAGAANAIETNVTLLSVDTSGANGDQFINEVDGIDGLQLSAGAGDVTLSAGGAVLDADPATDVSAVSLTAAVVGGLGGAASLQTEVTAVDIASAAGAPCHDVHLQNNLVTSGPLTINRATAAGGCDVFILNEGNTAAAEGIVIAGEVTATGTGADVLVVSQGPLTVSSNQTVRAAESVTLAATESGVPGDDVSIGSGATIETLNGDLSISAGGDVTVQSGATLLADTVGDVVSPGNLLIVGDSGGDSGTTIQIIGTGAIGATGGTMIAGNVMGDSFVLQAERLRANDDFTLNLLDGADQVDLIYGADALMVAGSLVINADGGVDDGATDTLNVNTAADTNPRLFTVNYDNNDGTGRFSQLRAGTTANLGTAIDVNRADIYRLNASAGIPVAATNVVSIRGADNQANQVTVGPIASGQLFEVSEVNCVHVLGKELADTIDLSQAPATTDALIVGGDGADDITGTPGDDVIFGGNGVDVLRGDAGDDFLFADHTLGAGGVAVVPAIVGGDVLIGGAGTDSAVSFGADNISEVEGTIFASGATIDVIAWLRAQFIFDGNGQLIVDQALTEVCTQFLLASGIHSDAFAAGGGSPEGEAPLQNPDNALDVNDDGAVAPGDALAVINLLNTLGTVNFDGEGGEGEAGGNRDYFYDVNGDNNFSPIDVLRVVNHLNGPQMGEAEGEGEGPAVQLAIALPHSPSPAAIVTEAAETEVAELVPAGGADAIFAVEAEASTEEPTAGEFDPATGELDQELLEAISANWWQAG